MSPYPKLLLTFFTFFIVSNASFAQDNPAPNTSPYPTVTRTARLAYFIGDFQVQRADNSGDTTAVLNMPLTEGSRLVTGDYAQAEIEFEDGSVVRLTPRTTVSLDSLTLEGQQSASTHLTLLGGLAYFQLRRSSNSLWHIAVGDEEIAPVENVALRVSLDLNAPPASIAVQSGSVRVEQHLQSNSAGGFQTQVLAGESLREDVSDPSRYFLSQGIAEEAWDEWNLSRDQVAADSATARTAARDGFASAQGYGWSDLDTNGSWYNVPAADGTSSLAWQPNSADQSFDPYGYGAWVWSGGGYLYASGYSWGWTPYRCGHWDFYPGLGWLWRPDIFCGRWGYGGYGGGYGGGYDGGYEEGNRPPHYRRPTRPIPGPGKVHPIQIVHGPNGLRPPTVLPHPVRIGNAVVKPLPPLSKEPSPRILVAGSTLSRDFPIDSKTRRPVMGIVAGAPLNRTPTRETLPDMRAGGGTASGSISRPIATGPVGGRPVTSPSSPLPKPNGGTVAPSGTPIQTHHVEVVPGLSPVRNTPAQPPAAQPVTPAPVRTYTPPPAPPPMRTYTPPPSQPAPARAPSPPPAPAPASAPATPKGK